jgi:hypothetical protein
MGLVLFIGLVMEFILLNPVDSLPRGATRSAYSHLWIL